MSGCVFGRLRSSGCHHLELHLRFSYGSALVFGLDMSHEQGYNDS